MDYKKRIITAGVLFLILIVFSKSTIDIFKTEKEGLMKVSFLNVGQGDAMLIQTPSRINVLIDTGPGQIVTSALDEKLNFFNKQIDLIISTHAHADHISGVKYVAKKYEIVNHSSNFLDENSNQVVALYATLSGNKVNHVNVEAGDRILIDQKHNIYIDILWPTSEILINDENESSVSTLLVYDEIKFLMTGDLGVKFEDYLVDEFREKIDSDVLKLGHHGSKTSSSLNFINSVKPEYVVVSAGENNKHGHPHKEVLDNLKIYKPDGNPNGWVLETKNGTISFLTDGRSLRIQ